MMEFLDGGGVSRGGSPELLNGTEDGVAGIVDQNINLAVQLFRVSDCGNDGRLRACHVQLNDLSAGRGDLAHGVGGLGLAADGADDAVLCGEGLECEEQAEAVGCAGDEPDLR